MKGQTNFFNAKKIAIMGIFVALSYAVSFIEFPMAFFGASFLKLDLGNVFITLIAFLFGPIEGVIVCLLKEGLRCITSSSACAGELANFISTSAFILLPSICYKYRRNIKTVIITLPIACLIATGVALLANRYIVFPVFAYLMGGTIFGMTVEVAFATFVWGLVIFNLIKTISIAILTLLLYKRLSNLIKRF